MAIVISVANGLLIAEDVRLGAFTLLWSVAFVSISIVLARRKGRDWYVGAMTNAEGRTMDVPLDFLDRGRFEATIYADTAAPDRTTITTRTVEAADTLKLTLAPSGGAAIRIRPR